MTKSLGATGLLAMPCLMQPSKKAHRIFFLSEVAPGLLVIKGQLISKRSSQAEDSPKKRTNEFVFTSMRRVFVRFLGKSSARKKSFWDYLTFNMYEKFILLKEQFDLIKTRKMNEIKWDFL